MSAIFSKIPILHKNTTKNRLNHKNITTLILHVASFERIGVAAVLINYGLMAQETQVECKKSGIFKLRKVKKE